MQSDVSRFGRGIGECDGPIKSDACLGGPTKLHEQRPFHAEEVEITGQPRFQRLDHRKRRRRPPHFGGGHCPIECDNG